MQSESDAWVTVVGLIYLGTMLLCLRIGIPQARDAWRLRRANDNHQQDRIAWVILMAALLVTTTRLGALLLDRSLFDQRVFGTLDDRFAFETSVATAKFVGVAFLVYRYEAITKSSLAERIPLNVAPATKRYIMWTVLSMLAAFLTALGLARPQSLFELLDVFYDSIPAIVGILTILIGAVRNPQPGTEPVVNQIAPLVSKGYEPSQLLLVPKPGEQTSNQIKEELRSA